MKYIVLQNQHPMLKNFKTGALDDKNEVAEISKIPNLNYLLVSTACLIKIDINLEETNSFLKAMEDISFEYKNKRKTLLKDTMLDECYIDYLQIDKSKMMKLKMQKEEMQEDEKQEALSVKSKKKK